MAAISGAPSSLSSASLLSSIGAFWGFFSSVTVVSVIVDDRKWTREVAHVNSQSVTHELALTSFRPCLGAVMHRSRSRDSPRRSESPSRHLPGGAEPITESDYFLKSSEFRVWLKDDKRKVPVESSNDNLSIPKRYLLVFRRTFGREGTKVSSHARCLEHSLMSTPDTFTSS